MMKHSPFDRNQQQNLLFVKNFKLMTKKTDVPYIDESVYQRYRQYQPNLHDRENQYQAKRQLLTNSTVNSKYFSKSLNHSYSADYLPRRKTAIVDYQLIRKQKYNQEYSLLGKYGPQALRYTNTNRSELNPYYQGSIYTEYYNNQSNNFEPNKQINQNIQQTAYNQYYPNQENNRQNIYANKDNRYAYNYLPKDSRSKQYDQYGFDQNPQSFAKQNQKKDSPNFNVVTVKQNYDSYYHNETKPKKNKNKYNTVVGNMGVNYRQFHKFNNKFTDEQNSVESNDLEDSNWKSAILQAPNTKNPLVYQSGAQQQSFGASYKYTNKNHSIKQKKQIPQFLQWHNKIFHKIS